MLKGIFSFYNVLQAGKIMKVFILGLPRTGTQSMHALMEHIGLKSLHFDLEYMDVLNAMDGDFSFLDRYDAISDLPIPLVYKDLSKRYPEAKFILTLRKDADAFANSIEMLYQFNKRSWLLCEKIRYLFVYPVWTWLIRYNHQFSLQAKAHRKLFGCSLGVHSDIHTPPKRENLIKNYNQHKKEVLSFFKDKPEKLYVLTIEQPLQREALATFLNTEPDKIRSFRMDRYRPCDTNWKKIQLGFWMFVRYIKNIVSGYNKEDKQNKAYPKSEVQSSL